MTNKQKKTTRARSPEKKDAQFERIIKEGKKLFVQRGAYGFSMRALARKLDMSQANLYNYVQSKRELWFAIRTKYLKQYFEELKELVEKHKDSSLIDLIVKWGEFFFEQASSDYKRFFMIYLTPPPPPPISKKPYSLEKETGTLEKLYKPLKLMEYSLNAIKYAFEREGIKEPKITEFFYYMFGVFFGAVNIETFLKYPSKLGEPIEVDSDMLSPERYRKYVLKEIRDRVELFIK